jgi:sterol 14alpha-demethylase
MNEQISIPSARHAEPPRVKGGIPWLGHMMSFARNPYGFVARAAAAGEIASFKLLGQSIVLLTGDAASALFYHATDEQVDAAAAYKLMTPIFGKGVVYDAPLQRRNEQRKMVLRALRAEQMQQYSQTIAAEVADLVSNWGDRGEIDIVDFMNSLTMNTSSHCLLGRELRYELTDEFTQLYRDLERGISALAYHFPHLPLPRFLRRDRARRRLQALVGGIIQKRRAQTGTSSDMFQSLLDMHYEDGTKLSENELTGMLIGTLYAGHHTSAATASWVLIELLRHPDVMRRTCAELHTVSGKEGGISFHSLRELSMLESVIKEALRLHPPLIILMRKVNTELRFKQYRIQAGHMIWVCPPLTQRMPHLFHNPDAFDPDRYSPERHEDKNPMAYQPFGGGKHKCSGNAFAIFQIKIIFAVLLRHFEFTLAAAPATYEDDYSGMMLEPRRPCRVRYRRLDAGAVPQAAGPVAPREASRG